MGDNQSPFSLNDKSPVNQLLISLLVIVAVGTFLFTGLLLAGTKIFNCDFAKWGDIISQEASEESINFLRYLLTSQDLSFFIIPGIIILFLMKPVPEFRISDFKMPQLNEVALVIILAFSIIPITSFTGQINSALQLPDWLTGVEHWMIDKEEDASRIIDILTTHNTLGALIFNLLIIAVIPAIGEELIFRGVFQKILCRVFKSGHIAVWIIAFVFSAIHFQFYGFLPRLILGLVFGYLFLWSGTLWLPVIAHFLNNAVSVIGIYLQGSAGVSSSTEISLWKQLIILPLPVLVSIVILFYFRNKSGKKALLL
jgi:uncharacterized protein